MSTRLRMVLALVVAFVLLQAADFAFTWKLLGARADVIEANPVARAVLESGGWGALAIFKCAVTALALAAALAVARRRPAASLRLLAVFCLLMLGVNVYSGTLLAAPQQAAPDRTEERALALQDELTQRREYQKAFIRDRDRILADLLGGQIELYEALSRLGDCVRHHEPLLQMPPAARLPDPNRPEQLAAYLNHQLPDRTDGRAQAVRAEVGRLFSLPADLIPDPTTPIWYRATPPGLAAN